MAGIDNSTVFLLHCDGADGSTTFADSSITSPKTFTALSNAKVDTAGKFAQCLIVDGGASFLRANSNTQLNIGTSDLTIDYWANISSFSASQWRDFLDIGDGGNTNGIRIEYDADGSGHTLYLNTSTYTFSSGLTLNNFYHTAFVRNGDTGFFFINGALVGTDNLTGKTFTNSSGATVGSNSSGSQTLQGRMDEVRFATSAYWIANFTPPILAYSQDTVAGGGFFNAFPVFF